MNTKILLTAVVVSVIARLVYDVAIQPIIDKREY
jgi:hypothetical protein